MSKNVSYKIACKACFNKEDTMRRKATLKSMQLTLKKKRLNDTKQKLLILKHISKQNCVLLPFLNDESLHTLGEFIFNVVSKRVRLDNAQLKKVKKS